MTSKESVHDINNPLMATLAFLFDKENRVLLGRKKRGFGKDNLNGFGGFIVIK